jgi:hypothetical protein
MENGLSPEHTNDWNQKYRNHLVNARKRGLESDLTFEDYLDLIVDAGIAEPSSVGRSLNQFQLGRLGDTGNYTKSSCRFITAEQNILEKKQNGGTANVGKKSGEWRRGLTKETNETIARQAASMTGRTKETHAGVAAQAAKLAKNFVLTAPDGTVHTGNNVSEFSDRHGLNKFSLYNVFSGKQSNHKGWTGHYQQPLESL